MSRCGTSFASDRGPREFVVDIDVIKARANDRIRELAAELLPNGREECGYWRTGSIHDEPGKSLAVTLSGHDQGMWCDHACRGTSKAAATSFAWSSRSCSTAIAERRSPG
jgi:hypothetical protein